MSKVRVYFNKYRFYVYAHSIDGIVFYVGKGSEARAYTSEGRGVRWFELVHAAGYFDVEILSRHNLQVDALAAEAEAMVNYLPSCNRENPHRRAISEHFMALTRIDGHQIANFRAHLLDLPKRPRKAA